MGHLMDHAIEHSMEHSKRQAACLEPALGQPRRAGTCLIIHVFGRDHIAADLHSIEHGIEHSNEHWRTCSDPTLRSGSVVGPRMMRASTPSISRPHDTNSTVSSSIHAESCADVGPESCADVRGDTVATAMPSRRVGLGGVPPSSKGVDCVYSSCRRGREIGLFTLSKLTGHAGTRFGCAVAAKLSLRAATKYLWLADSFQERSCWQEYVSECCPCCRWQEIGRHRPKGEKKGGHRPTS